MKLVIQRVSRAGVRVQGRSVARIGRGLLVLVGLEKGDGLPQAERAARRVASLRVFDDEDGRMNRGLDEIAGQVLAVSQFTLAGSIRRGRRPSLDGAMPSEQAEPLFDRFVELVGEGGLEVATGCFGAIMEVELVNDGPVTFLWEDSPTRP